MASKTRRRPPALYADPTFAPQRSGVFRPNYSDLETIIRTAAPFLVWSSGHDERTQGAVAATAPVPRSGPTGYRRNRIFGRRSHWLAFLSISGPGGAVRSIT